MALVDDVRQREAVGHNHLAAVERRADHLLDQLGARRHEQHRLGRHRHPVFAAMEQELAEFLPERGAAGVGARVTGTFCALEPLDEQPALGGLPGAVETVERDEQRASALEIRISTDEHG